MNKHILIRIVSIIIFILGLYFFLYSIIDNDTTYVEENTIINSTNQTSSIMNVYILEIYQNDNQLLVSNNQNNKELIDIDDLDIDISTLKKGQEIIIYYDSVINTSSPQKITNVKKIEIANQSNATSISKLDDNIDFEINTFNNSELTFTITDTNEIPYTYLTSYDIFKKNENKDYMKKEHFQNATTSSTSAYTR